ncbi:ATP-binding protein [uncultured Holdemanella sp.]|uniref:ATP-binding protein n=1 Tax=uncultured Holdemanella sp. TaxID=1763549 RepID=UPI0025CC7A6F|nr:ATP-binding protein [uncultured Holdemanella sp.]
MLNFTLLPLCKALHNGKSSLTETICDELKQTMDVKDEQIIYIDLDSRKNRNIKTADALEALIDSQTTSQEKIYLFIDEIQNVDSFEEVINGYRTDGGYSIFITGSNSYLLSGELSTKLTGRYIEFELYTLSFDEYLEMKKFYNKDINPNTIVELNNYILEGGFPRTVQFDDLQVKRTYTESVVREIFEKDIRKRVKIRNREAFESVEHFIINNFGATTSISGLQESLEKNGMKISRATLSNYIKILVDAKILYECSRFDMKSKKSLSGEKKYYVSDLSFYFSLNTDNKINYGPVLENIVYFYAKSHDYSISVGRIGKLECDFILRDHKMNYAYVQVAYTIALSKKTEDREYKSLESIRDNYPKYVMTTDYLLQNRNGIKHVNLIDFIISNSTF